MRNKLASLLITLLPTFVIAQVSQTAQNRPIVFRHVTLIDMTSEQPKPNVTVIVSGNRIAEIGKNVRIPKNAEVVNANGKFLIPGLWDSYTYTLEAVKNKEPYFDLLVANGVTGVSDAGTGMDLQEAAKLRNEITAGRILAPRLFYAGTVINGAGGERASYRSTGKSVQVKTADEARAVVESLYRAGADYIKTEKLLPPEILKEVIAAAHKHNMRVVAVPPSFVMDASNDGLDCVAHFVELYRSTSTQRNEYYELYRSRKIEKMSAAEAYAFFGPLRDTRDQPYYDQTLQAMARNKTFLVTNFAEHGHSVEMFELDDSSRRRFKTRKQLDQLEAAIKEKERQRRNQDTRTLDKTWKGLLQDIADLHKAGVMLLAGTQLNNVEPSSPGIWLHDDLYWFVQAGFSPFEALKTATVNPAIFMRREKDLGTIEKGKLADLVLLDANPLTDISNTRKINAVVMNGRYLSKEYLEQMLAEVEAEAKRR